MVIVSKKQPVDNKDIAQKRQEAEVIGREEHLQKQANHTSYEDQLQPQRRAHFSNLMLLNHRFRIFRFLNHPILFDIQTSPHLLKFLPKVISIFVQFLDLVLNGDQILADDVNSIIILFISVRILIFQLFQFCLLRYEKLLINTYASWSFDHLYSLLQNFHCLSVDLRERVGRRLAFTCSLSLTPQLLNDVAVETLLEMILCLHIEDLGEFGTRDEGLFFTGIEGEHFNGFGEVIIHRENDNFDENKQNKVGIWQK